MRYYTTGTGQILDILRHSLLGTPELCEGCRLRFCLCLRIRNRSSLSSVESVEFGNFCCETIRLVRTQLLRNFCCATMLRNKVAQHCFSCVPGLRPGALLIIYINIVRGAKRLWGESSMGRDVHGRDVHGAKRPWGETSMGRNVLPWGEVSRGEMSVVRKVLTPSEQPREK